MSNSLRRALMLPLLMMNTLEANQDRFYHTSEPRLNNENVDYSGNSTPLVSAGKPPKPWKGKKKLSKKQRKAK